MRKRDQMEARLGKRMRLLMLTVQAVLALSPALALAVGEQLGRIKGRVIDDQGQPVAGATVTVEGAALIGEPRQVKTDARGRFLIQRLAPGPYQVKVVVGEEQPLLRNASVQAGDTASLRIKTTEVEVMEITGMALSTQADAAQTGVAVDAKTLNKTVIRYFGSVPANVPGVTGGSNIKGGTGRNTRWLVDGLDITGRGGNVMPFDSVKSVDVVTGGGEAQYNALGGVVNTMTADGSDEWTAKASLYLVRAWMFDRTKAGTLANSFEQPFSTTRPGRGGNYLAALRVGGPIIKDKFWFDAAYKLLQNVEPPFMASPLGVPPYNIQHPSYKYTTQGARAKLQYAPTLRHRLRLSANTSPAAWDNADRSNSRLAVAETGAARSSGFVIGAWDYLLSEDITTTLQVGVTGSRQRWGPQGRVRSVDFTGCELFSPKNCVYDPHRAQHTNLVDGTRWYQGGEDSITSQRGFQFDPSVSIHGRYYGTHDIKIGIQASADSNNVTKETPGGYTYQDRKPGAKLEDGLCDPDNPATWDACYRRTEVPSVDTTQTGYQAGLYIQDRWWTPLEWLHVMPGIRLDYGTTYASGGEQVTSFLGFGPRLGLAFDITGDGRNVISAYYGRHTEPMNLRAAQRLDESRVQTVSTWQWDSNAMAFNTLVSKSGGEGNFSVDPNAKMPHSDEITLVARRALSPSLTASAEYTYKKISNRWATVEINRIWDPTGSRIVGWVDPQKQGQTVSFYTTPDDNHTN